MSNSQVNSEPKYAFLHDLNLDQDVVYRLSLHLDRIVSGSSDVYLTPLGKDNDVQSILKGWDEIFNNNKHKLNSELIDLENSNRDKFGPRSIAKPWKDRLDSLSSYFERDNCKIPLRFLVPSRYQNKGRLRPLSLVQASEYLRSNTNSGLPYFRRKSTVKERTVSKFDELLLRNDPCILFTRTQENNKTRDVWGFPIANTLDEMRYYRVLLDYQRKLSWRSSLIGPDRIDLQITHLIDSAIERGFKIYSVDFAKYDASVKKTLTDAAFAYISDLFQPQYSDELREIRDRFTNIGLLTPAGVLRGPHGVPSGSTFTNEVDSIVQYLIAKSSATIHDHLFQIQGDDGVYALIEEDIPEFEASFQNAGTNMNKYPKSVIADNYCIFLQNLYHPDYRVDGLIRGVYPTYRALNRLIHQERWQDFEDFGLLGKDYYSLRAISILENCKYHPLFEDLVNYIISLDKYSLKVSRGSVSKFGDYVKQSSGTGTLFNNHYGDNARGIRSFSTWKLIYK